ncbi:hypothetical protein [Zhongshania marina]|nr:hypothetical protein [Marortus luteolus]
MKSKMEFTEELQRQITRICRASKEGYKTSAVDRHRLEGFIHAGVFLGLTTNAAAKNLLESTYLAITGETLNQASTKPNETMSVDLPNYERFDTPTYLRK